MAKVMKDYKRTDIALEKVKLSGKARGTEISDISISEREAANKGIGAGRYISLSSASVANGDKSQYLAVAQKLADCIKKLLPKDKPEYLIAGLGNPKLTADSLGSLVADRMIVTRHMDNKRKLSSVAIIKPGVLGATGIESFDVVKGVLDRTKTGCVIIVDSLAAAEFKRLATIFQVSDAGLTPGSGVGNRRVELSAKSLGCKVLTVGVPLVVYASTIAADLIDKLDDECREQLHGAVTEKLLNHIVTPKDIDLIVSECADIVALALNLALHKGLSVEEVAALGN